MTKFEWLGLSHTAFRSAVTLRPRQLIRLVSAPGHDESTRLKKVQVVVSLSRLKQSDHTQLTTFLRVNLWV